MSAGIDSICFATSQFYFDLRTLARVRNVDLDKYYLGLGQQRMSVPSPDEDVITLACSAAQPLMSRYKPDEFDLVMFTTESGIDQSKAGAVYIRRLLGLSPECRAIELKQACYSSTAALQLAVPYVEANPTRKVLVIASDVARYGINTPGEPTQGCGAVAMVISRDPQVMEIDTASGCYTEDVMDFWRPNYRREALVDGKYSTKLYLTSLTETWNRYAKKTQRSFSDHSRFCYHLPFTRMAEKAHQRLAAANGFTDREGDSSAIAAQIEDSLHYNRVVGNSYTASLYIGLASLLDNTAEDLGGKRIGLFSYGSGCTAEYYSGVVQPGYRQSLMKEHHQRILQERTELNYEKYEKYFSFSFPNDGGDYENSKFKTAPFRLVGLKDHKRLYSIS